MTSFRFPRLGEEALVMGIINLSPESFYGASQCGTVEQVLHVAERMIEEGADILDIGAESSRPGSAPLSEQEELNRLLPVVIKLAEIVHIPISVDTYKPAVAHEALNAGASIINDITGLQRFPDMAKTIARFQAGVILMHMQGTPETMQDNPQYMDLLTEISGFLKQSITLAVSAGIDPNKIGNFIQAENPGMSIRAADAMALAVIYSTYLQLVFEEEGEHIPLDVMRKFEENEHEAFMWAPPKNTLH